MNRLAFYVTSAFTSGQLRQYGRRQDIFLQSVNSGEQLMLRLRLEHRCNEHYIFKEINNRHKLHVTLSDDSIFYVCHGSYFVLGERFISLWEAMQHCIDLSNYDWIKKKNTEKHDFLN